MTSNSSSMFDQLVNAMEKMGLNCTSHIGKGSAKKKRIFKVFFNLPANDRGITLLEAVSCAVRKTNIDCRGRAGLRITIQPERKFDHSLSHCLVAEESSNIFRLIDHMNDLANKSDEGVREEMMEVNEQLITEPQTK